MVTQPHATPRNLARRKPKAFKEIRSHRKVCITLYIDEALLAQLNEAWLRTDCPFFSRWVSEKLKEVLK